jgi:solute carrier family 25 citrate transporter 1
VQQFLFICAINGAHEFIQTKKRGFIKTGVEIVRRETPLGLYKGLGAVITGIVPKMSIRFTSFEAYKRLLANKETGRVSGQAVFLGM